HRRGGRFGTYAVWWVRQGVRRALANQSRTIRIPVHALGARYSLDQAARKLALQLGREPNEEELSGATGVGAGNVAQLLSLSKEPLSLDAPRGNDLDTRLGDSIADATSKSSMEQVVERQRSEQLGQLMCALSPRERDMVRMRFGLDGSDECTLEQIGSTFSVTRERVRQIVGSALEKLNRQTRMLHLELQGGAE
ncbi:MAG TPA: sigma-70 family RNA polymerase sigma factor, partial [Polyangiaceae bacterium]|nr:sigma-70 family RNA polymerase sigma factor [Polyangiaceae bacterium]